MRRTDGRKETAPGPERKRREEGGSEGVAAGGGGTEESGSFGGKRGRAPFSLSIALSRG